MEKQKAMKWVKALRSGKYKQGKGMLLNGDNDKYCCLGVLAKISGLDYNEIMGYNSLSNHLNKKCGISSEEGSSYDECDEIQNIKIPQNNIEKYFINLAEANDRGASFNEIADWIEKNYETL